MGLCRKLNEQMCACLNFVRLLFYDKVLTAALAGPLAVITSKRSQSRRRGFFTESEYETDVASCHLNGSAHNIEFTLSQCLRGM